MVPSPLQERINLDCIERFNLHYTVTTNHFTYKNCSFNARYGKTAVYSQGHKIRKMHSVGTGKISYGGVNTGLSMIKQHKGNQAFTFL